MECCVWRRCGQPSRWLRAQGSNALNVDNRKLLNCVRAILRGGAVLHFLVCIDSLLYVALCGTESVEGISAPFVR